MNILSNLTLTVAVIITTGLTGHTAFANSNLTATKQLSLRWQHVEIDEAVNTIVTSPQNPNILYASINDSSNGSAQNTGRTGVLRSMDGCKTWSFINQGLANTEVNNLSFDSNGNLYATTNDGFFKLKKDTNTWIPVLTVPKDVIASLNNLITDHLKNQYQINPFAGVKKLTPGAKNWIFVNTGLPAANGDTIFLDLATDAQGNLYLDTSNGMFKSTNGSTWTRMPFEQFSNNELFWFDPYNKQLYFYNSSLYQLSADGQGWFLIDNFSNLAHKYSNLYGSGTMLSIYAMAMGGSNKFCIDTNWGMYVQN